MLNKNQLVGLKYYEDLIEKIPRLEVKKIVDLVQESIQELEKIDNELDGTYESICCGSYRRGRQFCGDIDILIYRKDDKEYGRFLIKLVQQLEGKGLLKERLQISRISVSGSMTYMGICKAGSTHRRIDIKIYPRRNVGFALLYFTGSAHFNRSMRLYARKVGLSLSDHGISQQNQIEDTNVDNLIYCETE
jgi:DNA polymerase lambda